MRQILCKIPLLLCGLVLVFWESQVTVTDVIAILVVISATTICQRMEKGMYLRGILLGYGICSACCPSFLYFLPILLYDGIYAEEYLSCGVLSLLFLFALWNQPLQVWGLLVAAVSIAGGGAYLVRTLTRLEHQLITEHDTSVERNTALRNQNRQLLENQDNEIRYAMLKERNRIAREIHDNVGHMLSRSILQVGALQVLEQEPQQKEALSLLGVTLNQAMTTIRQSVHDLHDESVDLKLALEEALQPLRTHGFAVKSEISFSEHVPKKLMYSVIAIVKEGVSNILRHSNGNVAEIYFLEHPGFYQLTIQDNGTKSKANYESGIGLINMRDRIQALGGILDISAEETGFRIFASVRKEQDT